MFKYIGWKNHYNKWQPREILIDITVLALLTLIASVYYGANQ